MRGAAFALLAVALGAAAAGAGSPEADAAAAPLEGRVIRHIELVTRTIFDPPPERGRGFYALANRLHVRTRPATLRAALVLKPGDRWTAARQAESERHLRALEYLVPDSVVATPVGADSVDLRVVTHDNWTTSPEFGIESGGGQRYGSFAFTERNLCGLGTSLSIGYRDDVNGISRQAGIEDNEILGTHWRARGSLSEGTAGHAQAAMVSLPFWSDDAPHAFGVLAQHERVDSDLFSDDAEAAHVSGRRDRVEFFAGLGRRGPDGSIRRLVASFESRDRQLSAPVLRAGAPTGFARAAEDVRHRRLALEGTWARPAYIVRGGVDQIDREEDFDVGVSAALKGGFAPRAFGSTADEGFGQVKLGFGVDAGRAGFGLLRATGSTRLRGGVPREELMDVSARWIQSPAPRLTAVVGAIAVGGRNMPADYQLTLGGVSGLRAFPVHEMTGTEVVRGNAELRWVAARDLLHLVSLGAAAFWDGGRTRGTGAETDTWHHDVGFGLRLSLPHSALNAVARFDVAWPIAPAIDGRHGPAYSFGSGQAF